MMGAVKDFMQTVNFCWRVLGMSGGDALTTPWNRVLCVELSLYARNASKVVCKRSWLLKAFWLMEGSA